MDRSTDEWLNKENLHNHNSEWYGAVTQMATDYCKQSQNYHSEIEA